MAGSDSDPRTDYNGFHLYHYPLFWRKNGGKYGFERSLGVWGAMTGTNATGQALVRMVDPDRKTTVLEEMGPMNVINVPACYVVMPAVIAYSAGEISTTALFVSLIGVGVAFMAAMLVTAYGQEDL